MRRQRPVVAALALAALAGGAAGCAPLPRPIPGGTAAACGPREVQVVNASSLAIEQLYLGSGEPSGWGADLLIRGPLPPGAAIGLSLPGPAAQALRAVWVNGRAAEIAGLDACVVRRITVQDAAIRAE